MEKLILNFKGTQRTLIGKINKKLRGWASYNVSLVLKVYLIIGVKVRIEF